MSRLEDCENNGIESDLLQRISEGDKVAFSYLFNMYHRRWIAGFKPFLYCLTTFMNIKLLAI